jgi:cold shock CspA family protein
MGKSQESWNKKEVRSRKEKKRKDKEKKRVERKANAKEGSTFDDMIAYVDENGMISSTPPDPSKKKKIIAADIVIGVPRSEDTENNSSIRKGVVSFYNEAKGFGFIREPGKKDGIFFHANNAIDIVKENNMVTFEIQMGQKGPVAVNVQLDKK